MKRKCPYTELESVVLLCLEIAADILHGGKKALGKLREIPLSDHTTKRKCDDISKDLIKQFVIKLKKSPAYGLQLDKITDISDEAQMIVGSLMQMPKLLLSIIFAVLNLEFMHLTARSMFDKLNEFLEEHELYFIATKNVCTAVWGSKRLNLRPQSCFCLTWSGYFSNDDDDNKLNWTKCKSGTTDGATAMQGSTNGVVQKIKRALLDCVSNHCIIHHEALVVKKIKP